MKRDADTGSAVVICIWILILLHVCCGGAAAEPAPAHGKITGVVTAGDGGQPLNEAGVAAEDAITAVTGTGRFALTNKEGFFVLELPPGTYGLTVTYPNYEARTIRGIAVQTGESVHLTVALTPALVEIDAMRVVARPRGDVELVQLMKRRTATSIMDNISSEMITKMPESDVAGILSRMPGVTITEGKYMQARGMPKRYNRSLFNSAVLPTTKPNEELVPLDLFPAGVVESINVIKSYSPDLPANFSGGLALIQTRSIPDKFILSLSAEGGYNSVTTGDDYLTYRGGKRDWLGYDDGTRDKPGIIPGSKLVRTGRFGGAGFTPLQLERFGESFQNIWTPYSKTAPADMDYSFLIGDRLNKFGYIFYVNYKNKYQNRDEEEQNYYAIRSQTNEVVLNYNYDLQRSRNKVVLNGLFNVGLELTPDHKIHFRNFYIHTGTDEVMLYEGFNNDIGENIRNSRLRWVEEEIYSGQLAGDHQFYAWFDQRIDWRYTYSKADMWEPDTRETLYEYNSFKEQFLFADESQSGSHMWTSQEEDIHDAAIDWTVYFEQWAGLTSKLKFGIAHVERDRDFWHRRFRFMPLNVQNIDLSLPVEKILARPNINPYEFEIFEDTRTTDTYMADQRLSAYYVMLDLPVWEPLSLSGGLRFEKSKIDLISYDLFNPQNTITSSLHTRDWFPSVNLTWKMRGDMNLRLGYSETVSRPEFHELAPFEFTDVRGGRVVKGNPDLKEAHIKNYDVRWEWFLNDSDLVAASYFYKDFKNAIENTVQPTTELRSSFINAEDAWLWGIEFELRKNLGFIRPWLRHWTLYGNYIYCDSESEVLPQPGFVPTNLKRNLVGQADRTYNISLEYANPEWRFTGRLLYQSISDRINEIGGLGLPDIVLEDSYRFDLVLIQKFRERWELKFKAENLNNHEVEYTQGGQTYHRWKEGITWKLKLTYSF